MSLLKRSLTGSFLHSCVDYSLEEFDQTSYLMHMVRRMPNGYRELRSRFFVASHNHGNAQLGHDLAVHCNIEMTRKSIHLHRVHPMLTSAKNSTLH